MATVWVLRPMGPSWRGETTPTVKLTSPRPTTVSWPLPRAGTTVSPLEGRRALAVMPMAQTEVAEKTCCKLIAVMRTTRGLRTQCARRCRASASLTAPVASAATTVAAETAVHVTMAMFATASRRAMRTVSATRACNCTAATATFATALRRAIRRAVAVRATR